MHRTNRVIKVAAGVSLGLLLASGYGTGQAAEQVLDLTKQPAGSLLMGVPAESVEGRGGEPRKIGYDLPLRVDVKQFRVNGNSVVLELLLTNTGKDELGIASCLDGHKAFGHGAFDRRSLEFGFAVAATDAEVAEPIEVTFGSSKPGCTSRLGPGRSILVIMKARVPEQILAIRNGNAAAPVRVFVAEVKFADDRYGVTDRSRRVESPPVEGSF